MATAQLTTISDQQWGSMLGIKPSMRVQSCSDSMSKQSVWLCFILSEISGSNSGKYEDCCLLGCCAM
jgi:hypothetical protein